MNHYSCENCIYRDNAICLFYSKQVKILVNRKIEIKSTMLHIENAWVCSKFEEAMSISSVTELNKELEKDYKTI